MMDAEREREIAIELRIVQIGEEISAAERKIAELYAEVRPLRKERVECRRMLANMRRKSAASHRDGTKYRSKEHMEDVALIVFGQTMFPSLEFMEPAGYMGAIKSVKEILPKGFGDRRTEQLLKRATIRVMRDAPRTKLVTPAIYFCAASPVLSFQEAPTMDMRNATVAEIQRVRDAFATVGIRAEEKAA